MVKNKLQKYGEDVVSPIIDHLIALVPLVTLNPAIIAGTAGVWVTLKVSYALYNNVFKDESEEFMANVRERVHDVGSELIGSELFQQSLLITFDTLLRVRSFEKRKIIQKVYLDGFIPADQREKFAMERLYRIAGEISLDVLQYLAFVKRDIYPLKERMVQEKLASFTAPDWRKKEKWWHDLEYYRMPISEVISRWEHLEYDSSSDKLSGDRPDSEKDREAWEIWMERVGSRKREVEAQHAEYAAELVSLGIFRIRGDGHYAMTELGDNFLKYMDGTYGED